MKMMSFSLILSLFLEVAEEKYNHEWWPEKPFLMSYSPFFHGGVGNLNET